MTKFTNYDIIRSPVVTEKSTLASEHSQVVFDVAIDAKTPIVTPVPGDRGLLKPGVYVSFTARKAADGTLSAAQITAEKDGVRPPF